MHCVNRHIQGLTPDCAGWGSGKPARRVATGRTGPGRDGSGRGGHRDGTRGGHRDGTGRSSGRCRVGTGRPRSGLSGPRVVSVGAQLGPRRGDFVHQIRTPRPPPYGPRAQSDRSRRSQTIGEPCARVVIPGGTADAATVQARTGSSCRGGSARYRPGRDGCETGRHGKPARPQRVGGHGV